MFLSHKRQQAIASYPLHKIVFNAIQFLLDRSLLNLDRSTYVLNFCPIAIYSIYILLVVLSAFMKIHICKGYLRIIVDYHCMYTALLENTNVQGVPLIERFMPVIEQFPKRLC